MRTTVTLDADVERHLRQIMHTSRQGFKEALNEAVRRGLAHLPATEASTPFRVEARPMGLRTGLDSAHLHELAGDLEAEAFLATTQRLLRGRKSSPRK